MRQITMMKTAISLALAFLIEPFSFSALHTYTENDATSGMLPCTIHPSFVATGAMYARHLYSVNPAFVLQTPVHAQCKPSTCTMCILYPYRMHSSHVHFHSVSVPPMQDMPCTYTVHACHIHKFMLSNRFMHMWTAKKNKSSFQCFFSHNAIF